MPRHTKSATRALGSIANITVGQNFFAVYNPVIREPILLGMSNLPTGTVTFLFSDIEGSTEHAQENPFAWEAIRARHSILVRDAITANCGYLFQTIGDACCASFETAQAALDAALEIQRALQRETWQSRPIRVRIGIHTGAAQSHEGEYRGYLTLVRVQRIMSLAHGGQVLLSNPAAELLRERLPPDISLRDMGEHWLKGVANPEHVWQAIAPDLPNIFPPLASFDVIPNNLPIQLTSFVGRELERVRIQELFSSTRLLTLTGPGGAGKTRLSIQFAADLCSESSQHGTPRDGVWFVELGSLTDPSLVAQSVALSLGVRNLAQPNELETLGDYLREKQLVLILDNCEHLIDTCARLVASLLRACSHLKILTTSREPLSVSGELVYHVPSLSSPLADAPVSIEALIQYDAVKLFVERAAAVESRFRVNNANARAVAEICHRLDGIPLAIELAAARVSALSVEQIAARLDHSFRLLTGGSRTALSRQQTLRALIDWSYALLNETERVLLQQLSVFAGSWTLEAAEVVCAGDGLDVMDTLTHLVDKSLVQWDGQTDAPRYRMLEMIRQYAREKLAASEERQVLRQRHSDFFMHFAEAVEPGPIDPVARDWFQQLEPELDNLRAALEAALDEPPAATEKLAEAEIISNSQLQRRIGNCWRDHYRYTDALLAYRAAEATLLRQVPAPSPERRQIWCEIQIERISVFYWLNDLDAMQAAIERLRPVVKEYGTAVQHARLYQTLITAGLRSDRFFTSDSTVAYARAFVDALTVAHDSDWMRSARFQLGFVLLWHDDLDEAEREMLDALALAELNQDVSLQARCLTYLAVLHRKRNQPDLVRAFAESSLRIAVSNAMYDYIGAAHGNLAWLAWREGNLDAALEHGQSAQRAWQALPLPYMVEWLALFPLLGVALERDDVAQGIVYAERLEDKTQARLAIPVHAELQHALDAAKQGDVFQARTALQRAAIAARALNLL